MSYLLYDLSAEVDDTLTVWVGGVMNQLPMLATVHISSVDTLVIAGQQRKRIAIESNDSSPAFQYWIQGIGGTGPYHQSLESSIERREKSHCFQWLSAFFAGLQSRGYQRWRCEPLLTSAADSSPLRPIR